MSSAPSAEEIARDATWLPQALDAEKGLVRLVRMDAAAYRDASFLDDRMFTQERDSHVVPWTGVADAVSADMTSDARWIFHIGHVGSTLVARLLGEIEGVLSVREPRILRDVAALPPEQRSVVIPPLRKLLSRSFAPAGTAVVKATSFVSEIANEWVPPGKRALLMYAAPLNYIGSILAGENSLRELSALAPSRAQRLSGRAQLPQPKTQAELAAIAWACEMTALEDAAAAMDGRQVTWADFDAMLADMPGQLKRVAEHFGFAMDDVRAIATGPLMGRYSKATEYEYSPSLRRDLIAEAVAANRADIDSALSMLQSAADTSPLLGSALRRAECTESSRS